jgi:DNA-binding transcriptional MerR regulator
MVSASPAGCRWRIGDLSARSGVSIRLLRYYEQQGLMRPLRQANGYRIYAEDDVWLVRGIRALIAADICMAMIARILPSICEQNGTLIQCTAELADELRDERDRIDRRIGELVESKRALDLAIEAAPKRRLRGQNVST